MELSICTEQILQRWYILEENTQEGAVEDSDIIIPVSYCACHIKWLETQLLNLSAQNSFKN
jgi:hypothetical protein